MIKQIVQYNRSVEIISSRASSSYTGGAGIREKIQGFTKPSRRRLRRAVNDNPFPSNECWTFVLTYHVDWPEDGLQCKEMLNEFTHRMFMKYHKVPYLWVLEFQKRGAPHFHFFIPKDCYGLTIPEFSLYIGKTWADIIKYYCPQMTDISYSYSRQFTGIMSSDPKLCNVRDWNLNPAYLEKYVAKTAQKDIPKGFENVGRFWGTSRGFRGKTIIKLEDQALFMSNYPELDLKEQFNSVNECMARSLACDHLNSVHKKEYKFLRILKNFSKSVPVYSFKKKAYVKRKLSKFFLSSVAGGYVFFGKGCLSAKKVVDKLFNYCNLQPDYFKSPFISYQFNYG